MNRIDKLFEEKKKNILSVYFTAGHPALDSVVEIIKGLTEAGTDMIEIGIPFSDPLADGPVIQKSSHAALLNGMSMKRLFDSLKNIREKVKIPLLLMGYINPVLQYGVEEFCKSAAECEIDGVIIPDISPELYVERYKDVFEKYNIYNVFLVTTQTSEERIRMIDNTSKGFIYVVSTSSTTGRTGVFSKEQEKYFTRLKEMKLKNPLVAGFGIHNNETFTYTCRFLNGGIIGSAFVKHVEEKGISGGEISGFVKAIKG